MNGKVVLFNGVNTADDADSPRLWAPLSILSVGTMLRHAGYDPVLIDCQIESDWQNRLVAEIDEALYLGVTCMTGPGIRNVLTAIRLARATRDVPVVWGGYHATLAYEGILREGHADIAVLGPGEYPAVHLARLIEQGDVDLRNPARSFGEVAGVAFLGKRRVLTAHGSVEHQVVTTPASRRLNINELPPLNYSLIDPRAYYTARDQKVPYITSYGCPHACTYCSEPATSGRAWSGLTPERIVNEASAIWEQYSPQAVDFMDPNFSSRPKRVVDFARAARAAGTGAKFMSNMRAREVTLISEMTPLDELREAGFARIFIGVESGSDRMLTTLKKGASASDSVTAATELARAGIEVHASFMHDLPDEGEADSDDTMRLASLFATLPGNKQSHHFFMPYPGTELFEKYFGTTFDTSISQEKWASSSTYKANAVWSGRPEFRKRVLEKLEAIREDHPHAFDGTRLPHLEKTEAV